MSRADGFVVALFATLAMVAVLGAVAFATVSGIVDSYEARPAGIQPTNEDPVLVGAGDIADYDSPGTRATVELLDGIEGTVFTLGDNVQGGGSIEEFRKYYGSTWGRHRDRTRPAVGNHEYYTPGAAGYFEYFGEAAGDPDKGYYAYDLEGWRIIVLNGMCENIGGCGPDSPQVEWLREELAANDRACTLTIAHHPLFSSGDKHGSDAKMKPLYDELHEAGVEAVFSGSEGNYERFAPQDPDGNADPEGVRQFIVGTGGHFLNGFEEPLPNSEVRNAETHGVIKLTLREESYEWEFIPVEGETFSDSGSARCRR